MPLAAECCAQYWKVKSTPFSWSRPSLGQFFCLGHILLGNKAESDSLGAYHVCSRRHVGGIHADLVHRTIPHSVSSHLPSPLSPPTSAHARQAPEARTTEMKVPWNSIYLSHFGKIRTGISLWDASTETHAGI
ncbi:hypothetical protein BOTBODRAFT_269048 [Botryobasidium botryosum FD-172 SS1]|uniref:Uncharacterized protein n=1 Tax=Botryobasidium botryosum (strain FD-172 SS1) TaxID=930990 RepID=A0A067MN35_BOTB1|nr:hypothetical protein BOTBODRAFT_269048 [Botryobasidium botryosum FD-172 SS1]